eukprot:3460312-Lingulodinium_polyedra.AAC.1
MVRARKHKRPYMDGPGAGRRKFVRASERTSARVHSIPVVAFRTGSSIAPRGSSTHFVGPARAVAL